MSSNHTIKSCSRKGVLSLSRKESFLTFAGLISVLTNFTTGVLLLGLFGWLDFLFCFLLLLLLLWGVDIFLFLMGTFGLV